MNQYYVYILTNKKNGTLYIGSTSNLKQRINQHKRKSNYGFTNKYNLDTLVYVEKMADVQTARKREKQLKWWKRNWKTDLIEKENPEWSDLYETLA